jgi:hypothetical protein
MAIPEFQRKQIERDLAAFCDAVVDVSIRVDDSAAGRGIGCRGRNRLPNAALSRVSLNGGTPSSR